MTAIGFAIVITGHAISYINDYRIFGTWAKISAIIVLFGVTLMFAGICIKIWEVMP